MKRSFNNTIPFYQNILEDLYEDTIEAELKSTLPILCYEWKELDDEFYENNSIDSSNLKNLNVPYGFPLELLVEDGKDEELQEEDDDEINEEDYNLDNIAIDNEELLINSNNNINIMNEDDKNYDLLIKNYLKDNKNILKIIKNNKIIIKKYLINNNKNINNIKKKFYYFIRLLKILLNKNYFIKKNIKKNNFFLSSSTSSSSSISSTLVSSDNTTSTNLLSDAVSYDLNIYPHFSSSSSIPSSVSSLNFSSFSSVPLPYEAPLDKEVHINKENELENIELYGNFIDSSISSAILATSNDNNFSSSSFISTLNPPLQIYTFNIYNKLNQLNQKIEILNYQTLNDLKSQLNCLQNEINSSKYNIINNYYFFYYKKSFFYNINDENININEEISSLNPENLNFNNLKKYTSLDLNVVKRIYYWLEKLDKKLSTNINNNIRKEETEEEKIKREKKERKKLRKERQKNYEKYLKLYQNEENNNENQIENEENIIKKQELEKNILNKFNFYNINTIKLYELKLKINFPILFHHFLQCEHVLVCENIRNYETGLLINENFHSLLDEKIHFNKEYKVNPSRNQENFIDIDSNTSSRTCCNIFSSYSGPYPKSTYLKPLRRRKCQVCEVNGANLVTYEDRLAETSPAFFCL